jgi:hypothetical protein
MCETSGVIMRNIERKLPLHLTLGGVIVQNIEGKTSDVFPKTWFKCVKQVA